MSVFGLRLPAFHFAKESQDKSEGETDVTSLGSSTSSELSAKTERPATPRSETDSGSSGSPVTGHCCTYPSTSLVCTSQNSGFRRSGFMIAHHAFSCRFAPSFPFSAPEQADPSKTGSEQVLYTLYPAKQCQRSSKHHCHYHHHHQKLHELDRPL